MSGLRQRLAHLRQQSSISSSLRSTSTPPETPIAPTMIEEDLEEAAMHRDGDEIVAEIVKWGKFRNLSEEEIDANDFGLVRSWQVSSVFLDCFAGLFLLTKLFMHTRRSNASISRSCSRSLVMSFLFRHQQYLVNTYFCLARRHVLSGATTSRSDISKGAKRSKVSKSLELLEAS